PDVGSSRALALAKQHIDECIHRHQCCTSSTSPSSPRLPTRLVDCTDLARPRLVSTLAGEHGEYLALSYVWGKDQVHKTTKSNISLYEEGITLSRLPQTIHDAIYVTNKLGFRWLWIDSLCIIQDSDEDKLHEISRMHHVYLYAHLTIMAGSAKDVSEGFLWQDRRSPPDLYPDGVLGCMATRAWCMQEYLLSPRSLIFAPGGLLLFRCRTMMENSLFLPIPPAAEPGSTQWGDMHDNWRDVVEDYTRRAASVESDKLVACAAVAEQFHRALGSDAYLAGLWRSDLLRHLLWSSDYYPDTADLSTHSPHTRPAAYRAPSWSWAAIDGVVEYDEDDLVSYCTAAGQRMKPLAFVFVEVVDCWVTLKDPALPFGEVTDGALVLRGTLILCPGSGRLATNFHNFWEVPVPASFEQARRHHQRLGDLNLDEEDEVYLTKRSHCVTVVLDNEVTDELPEDLWLLPFGYSGVRGGGDSPRVHGIVLELVPPSAIDSGSEHPEKSLFRRIGYFPAPGYALPEWDPLVWAAIDGELPRMDIEIV
ncbi:HET-domain-containing protein, partial [Trametes versicolor FP-101664 SS1]|uniref:HET-domain-containing protein n=1 Tax=Trametes versicolor (strain FP-101664) TaxID=717944 RepID=UPI00046216DD